MTLASSSTPAEEPYPAASASWPAASELTPSLIDPDPDHLDYWRIRCQNAWQQLDNEAERHLSTLAALVVVREQLTQAQAVLHELEADRSECGEWWIARDRGLERPERKHYPDEGWSFCDGCSAAQSADQVQDEILSRFKAVLDPPSPPYLHDRGRAAGLAEL